MRISKLAFIGLGAVVVAGSGMGYLYRIYPYRAAAATLPQEIRAAKLEKVPLEPEDLTRSVPDSQNAAPFYQKIAKMAPVNEESLTAVIKGQATKAERVVALQQIAKSQPQLQLLEQVALRPHCDFHRDWSLGPDLLLPEYRTIREMARLLATQAILQSEAGRPEEALHTIQIGARMAHHVGEEPLMLAQLVRIATETLLDRVLQQILQKYQDREDIVSLARQTEQEFGEAPDIEQALRGDAVLCQATVDWIRSGRADADDLSCTPIPQPLGLSQSVVLDASQARSVSFWRRTFRAVRGASHNPLLAYQGIAAVNKEEEAASYGRYGTIPTYELSNFLTPWFNSAAEKVITNEAERRLRRTTLALLTYRLQHHAFPDSLASISSPDSLDPFLEQPLKYHRVGKGFRLYSVGEDGKDDGGDSNPPSPKERPRDMVVSF